MLNGEMAKYQIADRVQAAEADRIAKATRRARTGTEQTVTRRMTRAAFAAVLWPVKH